MQIFGNIQYEFQIGKHTTKVNCLITWWFVAISLSNIPPFLMPKAFINESNAKYQRLFKLYKQAYPDKRGDAVTDEVVKIWRDTLEKGKNEEKYWLFLAHGSWRPVKSKKMPIIFLKPNCRKFQNHFKNVSLKIGTTSPQKLSQIFKNGEKLHYYQSLERAKILLNLTSEGLKYPQ